MRRAPASGRLGTLWSLFAINWTLLAPESALSLPFAALAWGAAALRFAAVRARAIPSAAPVAAIDTGGTSAPD